MQNLRNEIMPRFNVQHKNKYTVWSSISDGFLTDWIDIHEWRDWRVKQYGEIALHDEEDINWKTIFDCFCQLLIRYDYSEVLKIADDMGFELETITIKDVNGDEYTELIRIFDKENDLCIGEDEIFCADGIIRKINNETARIEYKSKDNHKIELIEIYSTELYKNHYGIDLKFK